MQEMAKVGEILEKNVDSFKTLVRAGAVSTSYMNYFKMYTFYKSLNNIKSKMDRYQFVAENFKIDISLVRKAVSEMEKNI
jgi:hypothetical protein